MSENKTDIQSSDNNEWTISPKDQVSYDRIHDPEPYVMAGDSLRQPGVPQGMLMEGFLADSAVYPGVAHKYWVYVPEQYSVCRPAALMVFLDGLSYVNDANAVIVMDNLIHKGEMPVTIGIFVEPGDKGPGLPVYGGNGNRSIEYDKTDGEFARFLEMDLLPVVSRDYLITDDPEMRAICGISSGGLAAFAAAWNRPDLFRKVISHCGSFTAIRGGEVFPTSVRMEERKPLRVWLSTGKKDLNIVFGDWKKANEYMASSLEYKEYDYQFHLSAGAHNLKFGGAVFPDTLRWMFRDWKQD